MSSGSRATACSMARLVAGLVLHPGREARRPAAATSPARATKPCGVVAVGDLEAPASRSDHVAGQAGVVGGEIAVFTAERCAGGGTSAITGEAELAVVARRHRRAGRSSAAERVADHACETGNGTARTGSCKPIAGTWRARPSRSSVAAAFVSTPAKKALPSSSGPARGFRDSASSAAVTVISRSRAFTAGRSASER